MKERMEILHPTWIIVIGLICDIFGAIFIISPLLNTLSKRKTKDEKGNVIVNIELKQFVDFEPTKEWYKQTLARYGLGFLIVGFALQIIGNLLQNPPI